MSAPPDPPDSPVRSPSPASAASPAPRASVPGSRPHFTPEELRAPEPHEPLFAHPRVVAFQDIDTAGIIFFARVLEYFHDAYMAMLAARGFDVPELMRAGTFGIPLAHAEADYLFPLRFGDRVRVEVVAVRLGAHAFALRHRVRLDAPSSPASPASPASPSSAPPAARVCAVGQTIHVTIDRAAFRPIALPAPLVAALSPPAPAPAR